MQAVASDDSLSAPRETTGCHGRLGSDGIDLSAIDTDPFLAGDQAFDFGGTGPLTGAGTASGGELRFLICGGDRNIHSADRNGDGLAKMQIVLNQTNDMTGTDFFP